MHVDSFADMNHAVHLISYLKFDNLMHQSPSLVVQLSNHKDTGGLQKCQMNEVAVN
jgi:hypothetical protein